MKNRTGLEKARMYPLSLRPKVKGLADRRVRALRPRVTSFSNYIQQLIALDEKHDLINTRSFKFPDLLPGGVQLLAA